MNAKHTPGPWIAAIEPGISTVGNKCKVFSAKSAFFAIIDGGEYSEGCANARLIAAAPELLEALQQVDCKCSIAERDSGHLTDCYMPVVLSAMAKAEGRDE